MTPREPPHPPLCGADGQVSGLMTASVVLPCVAANLRWEVKGISLLRTCMHMCVRDFCVETCGFNTLGVDLVAFFFDD